jgi:AcrR family transcriptional regulator
MPVNADQTRERIVTAAARLFYNEGIRAASVDAIAAQAGVTKKTLYYHFRSKDELIAAYLESRDQPTLDLYTRWFDATQGTAADKLRGVFAQFAKSTDTPKWKGCGFLRTIAELANTPGHPALKAGAAHKKRFEAWLDEVLTREGVNDAAIAARRIVILLDGAATVMLIHRDPAYVLAAGEIAASLVEPVRKPGRSSRQGSSKTPDQRLP